MHIPIHAHLVWTYYKRFCPHEWTSENVGQWLFEEGADPGFARLAGDSVYRILDSIGISKQAITDYACHLIHTGGCLDLSWMTWLFGC